MSGKIYSIEGEAAVLGSMILDNKAAVPVVMQKETYRSYLIVNRDSPFTNFEALRGRTFAFSDPESNTGFLVPTFMLNRIGETADHFFSKTI